MKKLELLLGGLIALAVIAGGVALGNSLNKSDFPVVGSVQQGSEYHATTTAASITTAAEYNLVSGASVLGSVVITGANTGVIDFYDAVTSTNGTVPAVLKASIPASIAAGTYTFDANFYSGLVMVSSGSLPTSTITWR